MSVYIIIGIIVFMLFLAFKSVHIVPQSKAWVISRLGAYSRTWKEGLHFNIPIVEKVVRKVSLKEQIADFKPQDVITKDNITIQIDAVVFYMIMNAERYTYGIEKPNEAIMNLTATTLRNTIGELTLDDTLTSRDYINKKMEKEIDGDTDKWGIKILRVEIKNIVPPASIREAMEKQMRADREKQEMISLAEGRKKAQILEAEAQAEAIRLLKAAGADENVLALKSYEALAKVANGQATKIIIPSELQNVAGTLKALTEIAKNEED